MNRTARAARVSAATLVLSLVLLVLALSGGSALAAGPTVTVQVNGLGGMIDGGTVQLGAESDPPLHSTGLETIYCYQPDGPFNEGDIPANSVAAALLQLDPGMTAETAGYPHTLEFEGVTYAMGSLGFLAPGSGWHLWAAGSYVNLGQDDVSGLCRRLGNGQQAVLQAAEQVVENSPYFEPDTPNLRIEGMPRTVAVGQPFTARVGAYVPPNWGADTSSPVRTPAAGYLLSFAGGPLRTTDAAGQVTLSAPRSLAGEVSLQAMAAGSPPGTLPTPTGNSALSIPATVCVYDGSPTSPCSLEEVEAPAVDFGTQATGTAGAPREVAIDRSMGTLEGARISGVEVIGPDADDFLVGSNDCSGVELLEVPAVTCGVGLRFSPSAAGPRSATLVVSDAGSDGAVMVPLRGEGTAPPSVAGPEGPEGKQGPAGPTGATGPAGEPGPAGKPGPAGNPGPAGKRGPAGKSAKPKKKRVCKGAKRRARCGSVHRAARHH
ncbi:MAG TPA: hypothetical protein VMF55_06940 [Solirubrobacterales bacterium]|nr:hypothetical protein [Solirubrobacterales bacterium]